MANSPVVKLVWLATSVCLILGASNSKAQAAVTCGQVVSNLSPCISHILIGGIFKVPPKCCNGIGNLFNLAHTTPDRRTVCNCLKNAINKHHYPKYYLGVAAGLPKKCGVNIPYTISPSTDCSSVQ